MAARKISKEPEEILYVDLLVGIDDENVLRAVEDDAWANVEWKGRPETIRLEIPRAILPGGKTPPVTRVRVAAFAA
jgi:hypothetical protein